MAQTVPHPLSDLTVAEISRARDIVLGLHPGSVIDFRSIYLLEPPKSEVVPFLDLEHAGKLKASTPRPARLAQVRYDIIGGAKAAEYHESVIDVSSSKRVKHDIVGTEHHASLTM